MDVELSDLIASYPPQDTPQIQTIISGKQEFRELAASSVEKKPERGRQYTHQRFLLRYILQADVLLLFNKTGTGKTCSVVGPCEYYKNLRDTTGTSPINRAYIIVGNKLLSEEWKLQIACKCTPAGVYETEDIISQKHEPSRKSMLTRSIKSFYTIETVRKLANKLAKNYPQTPEGNEKLRRDYDGGLYYFDEVQNARIDPATGESEEVMEVVYREIWRLFHVLKRSKIIIGSATPMIDRVYELASIMNLILPAKEFNGYPDPTGNSQLPIRPTESFDLATAPLAVLEPYFRGRISYVRELDTGAIPQYKGVPIPAEYNTATHPGPYKSLIEMSIMSEFQARVYLSIQDQTDLREIQRQAALIVYPDGTYGEEGFGRWSTQETVYSERLRRQVVAPGDYRPTPELAEAIRDRGREFSCKFYDTVNEVDGSIGNRFCYSNYAKNGAVALSFFFEAKGYERFSENSSIFTAGPLGVKPLCATGPDPTRIIRPEFSRSRKRYALLLGDTPQSRRSAILEAFNSYENRHGDIIKVLIGSPTGRLGINLENVLQIHLMDAWWNESSSYQAVSRGLRSTSHDILLNEERQRLTSLGYKDVTPSIVVNIYRHAAVLPTSVTSTLDVLIIPVDVVMYQRSEEKDHEIKAMERKMKQCAVDCQVHYARNTRVTDVDNSVECDYQVCAYECVDPEPAFLDVSTYDVLYADETIEEILNEIVMLFRQTFQAKIEDLHRVLNRYRPKFIDMALERLISRKIVLYDRYGFPAYLCSDRGVVFLTRDFPTIQEGRCKYELSIYSYTLITEDPVYLAEHVSRYVDNEQMKAIRGLENVQPSSPEFNTVLDNLSLNNKAKIVEAAVSRAIAAPNEVSDIDRAIITKYRNLLFSFHEPVEAIEAERDRMNRQGTGKGRKKENPTEQKITRINPMKAKTTEFPQGTGEIVYLHGLYLVNPDKTNYDITAKFLKAEGTIKILKPSEPTGWRELLPEEIPVYNRELQIAISRMFRPYEQFPFYGFMLAGRFLIRDKSTENEDIVAGDARKYKKGRLCTTLKKGELAEFLFQLDVPPPPVALDTTDRQAIINFIVSKRAGVPLAELQTFTQAKLEYFYKWLKRRDSTKESMCNTIRNRMATMDPPRLLVI